MNKYYNIFLDDERFPKNVTWVELPLVEWTIVRNYNDFCDIINKEGLPKNISFDHDLGDFAMREAVSKNFQSFDYNNLNGEKTGKDCANFLVNYCLERNLELPNYYIHTINPIGAENIKSLLESYRKSCRD